MNTIEYLSDPALRAQFLPPILAAVIIGQLGAMVSALVVLRRLAFIGQGVSHSAFTGVGLAFYLGAIGVPGPALERWFGQGWGHGWGSGFGLSLIVLVVAMIAAWGVRALASSTSGRGDRPGGADTAIGIVLAVAMAMGFVLHGVAARLVAQNGGEPVPGIETVLFGSILATKWPGVIGAIGAFVLVAAPMVMCRRDLVFWAMDPEGSRAFGVRAGRMQGLLLTLVAVAVVATMQLVGVVLATALIVMPGAIALRLSDRLGPVLILSHLSAMVAVVGGMVLSFDLPLPGVGYALLPGPAVVFVLAVLYGLASLYRGVRSGRATKRTAPAV